MSEKRFLSSFTVLLFVLGGVLAFQTGLLVWFHRDGPETTPRTISRSLDRSIDRTPSESGNQTPPPSIHTPPQSHTPS
ncbi:MAG: hypothetical protein KC964_31585, partial [Candidatus Omnitrophica bacterium]|nr:hypothetical protein [Candidatus Omnitrophota bacterium]